MFEITNKPIITQLLLDKVLSNSVGGVVTFEGRVRDHNFGREVLALEYEVYNELALLEGERILTEATAKFGLIKAHAVHRYGKLGLQDIAVTIVAVASHRDEAFSGCRYIIDELKQRVPIWKKEHYASGKHSWVDCPGCRRSKGIINAGLQL